MTERKLLRLATALGATWWLARIMFSRSERRKLDLAMQTIGDATEDRTARDNTAPPRSFGNTLGK